MHSPTTKESSAAFASSTTKKTINEIVTFGTKHFHRKENVLKRVVIPRTITTMVYINDELDEIAREEFYRIKKILANKYNEKKKKEKYQEKIVCLSCGVPINKPGDTSKLDAIKKEYGDFGREKSKFLEAVATRFPYSLMCDTCMKKYNNGQLDNDDIVKDISIKEPAIPIVTKEEIFDEVKHTREASIAAALKLPSTESIALKSLKNFDIPIETQDLELGTFEIEVEETTKIIRTKNEDGTVTEQKRIIRKKTERRAIPTDSGSLYQPSIAESAKSSGSKNAKTIGLVTLGIPNMWRSIRIAQSLNFPKSQSLENSKRKTCFSTSILSIKFTGSDSVFSVCDKSEKNIITDVEKILQIHNFQNNNYIEYIDSTSTNDVTGSEIVLLENAVLNKGICTKSKSLNDIKTTIKNYGTLRCNSYEIRHIFHISQDKIINTDN